MTGLQAGMRKLGLGVQDMDGYVKLISGSSKDLALFKGSVFEGRKAFEDIGQGMQQYNYQLRAAGLTQEEINAGTMSYLKLQTQVGMAQNMTTKQLADGAKKYLIEQDALTKLTGASRQEMEAAQEEARGEQRFRAKLESMRASGDAKQIAAADELEKANKILSSQSKEAGQGFRDLSTGMVTSEAAQKALIGTNGVALEQATKIADGQANAIDGVQQVARAFGQNAKDLNTLGQTGTYEDISIKYSDSVKLGIFANKNLVEEYQKIEEDAAKQGEKGKKAADDLLDANIKLAQAQQQAMIDLQAVTAKNMLAATDASTKLATVGDQMTGVYDKLQPVMAKFMTLMGDLAEKILPPLIDGLIKLLELIPGVGPKTEEASNKRTGVVAGALTGAATGALIGSFVPIIGTAVGAAVGGVIGGAGGYMAAGGGGGGGDINHDYTPSAAMATGGPVKSNTPYLVGEKGPELFVPKSAGNIVNNGELQKNISMPKMPAVDNDQSQNMPKLPDMSTEYNKIAAAIRSVSMDSQDLADLAPEYKKIELAIRSGSVDSQSLADLAPEYKKIESGILGASKNAQMLADLAPEYKKIDLATKDIAADIQSMAKYDDLRATTTKTFTEKYTDYTKSMSDFLDQDLTNTTKFMEAGGTSAVSSAMSGGGAGSAGGGTGIKPVSSGAPGMTGAGSLEGLKMKKGDVQAADAGVHPKLIEMAKQVQANMPNFAYFSAFNDQYHQENAPSSFHTKGLAMDFALNKAPTKEEGQAIVKYLQSIGASTAIDEYNNPSSKATAGHIHAQIPGFADGGIALEPTIAMVAEKGPEVMMPLTNDGFLGQLNTGINNLLPQQQRMVSLLEDISRSQASLATATQIMASVASN
jgi:hypothetical protein